MRLQMNMRPVPGGPTACVSTASMKPVQCSSSPQGSNSDADRTGGRNIGSMRARSVSTRSLSRKRTMTKEIVSDVASWSARGIFGIFPSKEVCLDAQVIELDISQNSISNLDCTRLLKALPNLRKLDVAGNLIMSLASFVPLGIHPTLSDLELRGNPCFPAGGRTAILAALLVPQVSSETRIAAAAEAALMTAIQVGGKIDVSRSPRHFLASDSVDEVLKQLGDHQPLPFQDQCARSRHGGKARTEIDARRFLEWLRSLTMECDLSQSVRLNKNCLKPSCTGFTVGCSGHVGADKWFPCLEVLNGRAISLHDFENVAVFVADEVPRVLAARASKLSQLVGPPDRGLSISRQKGERYAEYLLRVRREFIRYRRRQSGPKATQKFYSTTFEEWRRRSQSAGYEDSDPDEDEVKLIDPIARRSEKPAKQDQTIDKKESDRNAMMENKFWHELRLVHERVCSQNLEPKNEAVDQRNPTAQDTSELPAASSGLPSSSLQPISSISAKNRPLSAPLLGRSRSMLSNTCTTSKSLRPTDRLLKHKPCDYKAWKFQVRCLSRTYARATWVELPTAARVASEGRAPGRRRAVKDSTASSSEAAELDISNPLIVEVVERLRKRGIALGAAEFPACKQWMQQLAEDYPDQFCNSSLLSETIHESKTISVDCREDALVDSNLWVLDVHGDPTNERDWHLRGAWLGPTGRLWLEASGQRQEQNASGRRSSKTKESEVSSGPNMVSAIESSGFPEASEMDREITKQSTVTLYLGGTPVTDLSVLKVETPMVAETLAGRPVYAMLIVLPGARYSRKKFLAAQDAETRERWIRACSAAVRTSSVQAMRSAIG